jgi:hypothetical protein
VTDNDEVRRRWSNGWPKGAGLLRSAQIQPETNLSRYSQSNTEQNAATLARIHNENLAELKRLRSAVDIYESVNAGYAIGFRVRPLCPNLPRR